MAQTRSSGQSYTGSSITSISDINQKAQSLTFSPKLPSYGIDYVNYNYNNDSGNNANSNDNEYPDSDGQLSHDILNNRSPPPVVTTQPLKSRENRNARLSHDDLYRSRTDPRGLSKQKKHRRSKKEQKKWKKKMKEIGKNHPEFELSYDLLLGIRTSTSLVNSSIVRSSMNPADDDSSDDDELSLNIFRLHLSIILYPCTSSICCT